jgi:exopolysaccharide biosynthesis protein
VGRHPRAALGCSGDQLFAVACDGRSEDEAGLTIPELAGVMVELGACDALNLDGGGSTSLVCGGRLTNVPRESHGIEVLGGREVATALVFTQR